MYSGLLTPERASEIGVKHVQFKGVDGVEASIPIEKALSPYGDVLLAYEMNGELLPPEHGVLFFNFFSYICICIYIYISTVALP